MKGPRPTDLVYFLAFYLEPEHHRTVEMDPLTVYPPSIVLPATGRLQQG